MLEFNPVTIVCTILNLLILYLFFRKFLFGRVNAILDQRAALIKENMDSAKAENAHAQALKAEYEGRLSKARQEAARIMADAQERAERTYETRLSETEGEVQRMKNEAKAQIDSEREEMLRGTRQEVAALALLAAARVAQTSVDEQEERILVDSFLAEVGEQA